MRENILSEEFSAFNTMNSVSAYTEDRAVLTEAVARCNRYEHLFSRTSRDSQLVRINEAGGRPVSVDEELSRLIETALAYCGASDGLFDITMGGVVALWDFKRGIVPERHDVEDALAHVDYRSVHVEGRTVWIDDPRAHIDLGGIAKGYIADRLCRLFESHGVKSGIINLGGNVAVVGEKPDGSAWNVGIRMPLASSVQGAGSVFATVAVRDASVVTSGLYERAFSRDGVLYHHILDPRTGYPARTDLVSATVVSEASLDGDGYTTALVLMGLDGALSFVEALEGVEAVFVAEGGDVYGTSGIGKQVPFRLTPARTRGGEASGAV